MINLKAVIPVAGLGMHMLPATKAIPKEMLPIVDKPMIQYIVDEIVAAGIKEIVLVTHSSKNAVENHFDTSYELEALLEQRVKRQLEEKLHSAKLRKAGEVLETAGILDTYDAEEVLRLLTAHKAEILKTDRSDRNGKYEQIADPHSEER